MRIADRLKVSTIYRRTPHNGAFGEGLWGNDASVSDETSPVDCLLHGTDGRRIGTSFKLISINTIPY